MKEFKNKDFEELKDTVAQLGDDGFKLLSHILIDLYQDSKKMSKSSPLICGKTGEGSNPDFYTILATSDNRHLIPSKLEKVSKKDPKEITWEEQKNEFLAELIKLFEIDKGRTSKLLIGVIIDTLSQGGNGASIAFNQENQDFIVVSRKGVHKGLDDVVTDIANKGTLTADPFNAQAPTPETVQ